MAAEKAHVIHQGILARHPQRAHGAAVDSARVKTDAGHDVVSTARRLQQRLGRTRSLEPRRRIENVELGLVRMKPDQHAIGAKPERVADDVVAGRDVNDAMLRDGLLNESGFIGHAIALRAEGPQIDPFRHRRQTADRVRRGRRQSLQRRGIVAGLDLPVAPRAGSVSPCERIFTSYISPAPASCRPLSRNRAKTGT